MRIPIAAAITATLLLIPPSASAQQAPAGEVPRAAIVLVLADATRSSKAHAQDSQIESFIQEAATLELSQKSLEIAAPPDSAGRRRLESLEAPAVAKLGREAKADFVLVAVFQRLEKDIRMDLSWYRVTDPQMTSTTSRQGALNLNLDQVVAEMVQELLTRESSALQGFTTTTAAVSGNTPPAATAPKKTPPAQKKPAPPQETVSIDRPLPPTKDPPRFRPWEIGAGCSAFLATGEAADYFSLGVLPTVQGAYYWQLSSGTIGVSLTTGANLFQAEGNLSTSAGLIAPLGFGCRYIAGSTTPLALLLHLSGGPAVLHLAPDGGESLNKIIGFLQGGLGLHANLGEYMGVVLDATYQMFFEGSGTIMGFAPGLYLLLRL